MLPICYPSSINSTTGLRECVVYYLSGVTGLARWTDYIPVKDAADSTIVEGSSDNNGFQAVNILSSTTGKSAWIDYVPVYNDIAASVAWAVSATGYIPVGASGTTNSTPSFYLNLSNAVNATIADAQGNGTITSSVSGNISAQILASRVTGVAPLYVNFDMTGTTKTGDTNPTHNLFYSTSFGDTGAGTWANGVQSSGLTDKNWGFGPVTGHVYETPGTYTVQMSVTDGSETKTKYGTIVVLDPNVVYDPAYGAGYETICISNSNNFTGAPGTGGLPGVATYVNRSGDTDMYAALNAYKANNKRILFCKADTWTCSDQITLANLTGLTIDGYGTGAARAFGSGTLVPVTPGSFGGASGKSMFNITTGNADLRICSLKITSNSGVHCAAVNNTMAGMLFSKVEIRGCSQGWNVLASQNPTSVVPEQTCLYECVVDDLAGEAFYDTPNAVTATYNATTDIFSATAHGKAIGDLVKVRTNASQSMPANFSSAGPMGAAYYISSTNFTANQFSLATTPGSGVIDITSTGTCTVADDELNGGISAYVALTKGGIMGCYFDSCNHGEQVVRIPFADRAHINNNYFARPNQTKNNFRIHSVVHLYFPVWSEKFVVSGNVITNEGGYDYNGTTCNRGYSTMAYMGTAGNGGVGGEWVRNGIFENNFIKGSLGYTKDYLNAVGAYGPSIAVRNNIADLSVGDRTSALASPAPYPGLVFLNVGTGTADQTVNVSCYNNTLFSNMSNSEVAVMVTFTESTGGNPDPDATIIKNNILYLPHHASGAYRATYRKLGASAATNITATNNTDEMSTIATSPNFAAYPPVALTDWRPTTGYAVNGGATVPVLRDFNMATRVGSTYDLGAVLP